VAVTEETILLNLIAKENIKVVTDRIQNNIRQLQEAMGKKGFLGVLAMNTEVWAKFNKSGLVFSTLGGRLANRLRMLTHGVRGFKMEMLAIMFFGMNIARMFQQWNMAALDTLGITEFFNQTMQLTVIEAVLPFTDAIFSFIDSINELDPTWRKLIGSVMLGGQIFGTVLQFLGSFILGIGGLIQVFGAVPAGIKAILMPLFKMLGLGEKGFVAFTNLGLGMSRFMSMSQGLGKVVGGITDFINKWAGKTITFSLGIAKDAATRLSNLLSKTVLTVGGKRFTLGQAIGGAIAMAVTFDIITDLTTTGKIKIEDIFGAGLAAWLLTGSPVAGVITLGIAFSLLYIGGALSDMNRLSHDLDTIHNYVKKELPEGFKAIPAINSKNYQDWSEYLASMDTASEKLTVVTKDWEQLNNAVMSTNYGEVLRRSDSTYSLFSNRTSAFTNNIVSMYGSLPIRMSSAYTSNKNYLINAIDESMQQCSAFFPSSPPLRGAFAHPTPYMRGIKLMKQFANGISKGTNFAVMAISRAVSRLNHEFERIRMPRFSGWNVFGGWFNPFRYVGMQAGGIVTRPTLAMVGEAGPEAVIPLDRAGSFAPVINIEVNTTSAAGLTGEEIATIIERRLGEELRRLSMR